MFQYYFLYNYVHVSVIFFSTTTSMFQYYFLYNYIHVSVLFSLQLHPCFSTIFSTTTSIFQKYFLYNYIYVSVLISLQLRPCFSNIFPENLVQATFQHQRTVYLKGDLEPEGNNTMNISDLPFDLNETIATTTQSVIVNTVIDNITNTTYVVVKETETKWIRTLPYNQGINVLGEFYTHTVWVCPCVCMCVHYTEYGMCLKKSMHIRFYFTCIRFYFV